MNVLLLPGSLCDERLFSHRSVPALHRDLAERTPRAELAIIADAGHLSTIDQPDTTSDLLVGWIQTISNENHIQEGNHAHQHA